MKYYVHYYINGDITAYAEHGYRHFFMAAEGNVVEYDYNFHGFIGANWVQVSADEYKAACLAIITKCDGWKYSILKEEVEAML